MNSDVLPGKSVEFFLSRVPPMLVRSWTRSKSTILTYINRISRGRDSSSSFHERSMYLANSGRPHREAGTFQSTMFEPFSSFTKFKNYTNYFLRWRQQDNKSQCKCVRWSPHRVLSVSRTFYILYVTNNWTLNSGIMVSRATQEVKPW